MTEEDDAAWELAPLGLVRLADSGAVQRANAAARLLLGGHEPREVFAAALAAGPAPSEAERTVHCLVGGEQRALAWRLAPCGGDAVVIAFRDVTRQFRQQRRIAAVATTASSVASERSLPVSLGAIAREVARADGMAGVQILAAGRREEDGLRVMGSAGFPHTPRFFELLLACRARGARLRMLEAYESGRRVVVPHRYAAVMGDPAWAPLHEVLREPRWDAFVSVPLLAHGRPIGVLNAFFSPEQPTAEDVLAFLETMADQAALALDYAELLESERADAGRAERQRLARELHDSVVQQVFSIGMQTEALKLLSARSDRASWPRVSLVAQELESTTRTVLGDLRSLVSQLHPAPPTRQGFCQALTELVASTRRRSTLTLTLDCPTTLDRLDQAMAEDLYFVVAEALHNAVKHADANTVDIRWSTIRAPERSVSRSATTAAGSRRARAGRTDPTGVTGSPA